LHHQAYIASPLEGGYLEKDMASIDRQF
jgi:hypothetical protein